MISDVLSDGISEIAQYLEMSEGGIDAILAPEYVPDPYVRATASAVAAMERTRLSPGFDVPPDAPVPELPVDDWELFKQVLENKKFLPLAFKAPHARKYVANLREIKAGTEDRLLILDMIRMGYDSLVVHMLDQNDVEAVARLSRLRMGLEACADTASSLQRGRFSMKSEAEAKAEHERVEAGRDVPL